MLEALKEFDVQNAEITLWTFKGSTPKINGHWVETSNDLEEQIKSTVLKQSSAIEEVIPYSLLSQNNEASVLSIPSDETSAHSIFEEMADNSRRRRVTSLKTLRNAKFYVVKLVSGDDVVYAARKTDASWRTKAANSYISAVYREKELTIEEDANFRIHRDFDLFIIAGVIYVIHKNNFESILSYREAHERDFSELQKEEEFVSVFCDLEPLVQFVGSNKIQLRRMSAIRQKKFYADVDFMNNLRNHYKEFRLDIEFDEDGMIRPTPETCRDVMTALLDHRLRSGFSGNDYDVPDAVQVKS